MSCPLKTNKKNPGLYMAVRLEISTLLSCVGQSQQRHGLIDRLMAHSFMIFDALSGRLRYKCHPNLTRSFALAERAFACVPSWLLTRYFDCEKLRVTGTGTCGYDDAERWYLLVECASCDGRRDA